MHLNGYTFYCSPPCINTHRLKSCHPCHRGTCTHLFWKPKFIFCDRRTFFSFKTTQFLDGELKNFPDGITLKIIITVHWFVIFHFFSITSLSLKLNDCRYQRALLAATREYHPSIPDDGHLLGTKLIEPCHFYIDDTSYFM